MLLAFIQITFGQNYLVLDTGDGDFTMSVAVGDLYDDSYQDDYDDIVVGNYCYPYMEAPTPSTWHSLGGDDDYKGFITIYWNNGDDTFTPENLTSIDCGIPPCLNEVGQI